MMYISTNYPLTKNSMLIQWLEDLDYYQIHQKLHH